MDDINHNSDDKQGAHSWVASCCRCCWLQATGYWLHASRALQASTSSLQGLQGYISTLQGRGWVCYCCCCNSFGSFQCHSTFCGSDSICERVSASSSFICCNSICKCISDALSSFLLVNY